MVKLNREATKQKETILFIWWSFNIKLIEILSLKSIISLVVNCYMQK